MNRCAYANKTSIFVTLSHIWYYPLLLTMAQSTQISIAEPIDHRTLKTKTDLNNLNAKWSNMYVNIHF